MTLTEFNLLAVVIDMVNGGKVVARLRNGDPDYTTVGTACYLCRKDGSVHREDNVLDLYLRVIGAFDFYWPVRELMEDVRKGWFCEYTPPR